MSRASEHAKQTWAWIREVNWYWNMKALALAPYTLFTEYDGDGNADRERGMLVIRDIRPEWIGAKWLLQQDGRIDPAIPFDENPRLKLFRDEKLHEWFKEEYCVMGYQRSYGGNVYRVKVPVVDDNTVPPNSQSWELVEAAE